MKIRKKLLVTMIPLVSASIMILSYLAIDNFAKTIQSEIVTESEIITENIMDKLSRTMFERVADVRFLSTGNVLSNPNFTMPEKVDYLRDMERTYKTYASMSIYAANGTKVGDTRNILLGLNESNKPFFKNAIQGKIYYDNTPVLSQSLRQYVIHFSAPIYSAEGEIDGVVTTRYPLNKLHDIFKVPQPEENSGKNLNSRDQDVQVDLVSNSGLILYSNYDRKSILSKSISNASYFQQLKESGSESTLTSVDGEEAIIIGLGQGRGYLDYKGSGWFLILTERSEVVFAGLYSLIQEFLIISGIILIAAVLVVFVLASRISKPITLLRRAATEVSKGRYDIPIVGAQVRKGNNNIDIGSGRSADELEELASTLETMRQNVHNVNSNLSALVVNRTKQLETANEVLKTKELQLEEANTNLIAADRAKEEFMSMISHELKSPLAPMKLYTEMLLKTNSAAFPLESPASTYVSIIEKQKKGLKIIHKNILRLETLVSDILDVYKLDIGTLKLQKIYINVTELIEGNVTELKPLTQDKQVQLIADIQAAERMSLWCDPNRITQVICNLVRNSIDFVPEKTGIITIRADIYNHKNTEARSEKGQEKMQMVLFAVEDNGIGIPPDKVDSLFRKFYQLDTTLTRRHGGTGLGLVISKGIIEAHGGEIWIDKKYAKGTSVKFTLPARRDDVTTKEEYNDKEKKNTKGEQ
jgi:signal transduction histidine kinase